MHVPQANLVDMKRWQSYHVYACGCCQAKPHGGDYKPEYVFTESVCPNCVPKAEALTSVQDSWLQPAWAELATLEQMTTQRDMVEAYAQRALDVFDGLQSLNKNAVRYCYPDFARVLCTARHERQQMLRKGYHLNVIRQLLDDAQRFSDVSHARPFFDFCIDELRYFLPLAGSHVSSLNAAVRHIQTLDAESGIDYRMHLPNLGRDYEPEFGKEQIALLRRMGSTGEKLLAQPLHPGALHYANLVVESMRSQARALTRPEPSREVVEVDAWLRKMDQEFWADVKKQTSGTRKRTERKRKGAVRKDPKRLPKITVLRDDL